ncbi:hypothetical protein MLDJOKPK_00213 [Salmonella phage SPAsTU]|nr:hypothetical protein STsAS_197 [Salmonella phage STsAS]AWN09124.1 hypothetical protein MLDJOKPK_00213 [Salmonella phage SPAsTU]
MNNLAFTKGVGLILNEAIIPGTDTANWEALVLRLSGKKVNVCVTNELPLNGAMAAAGPDFAAFNVPYDTASSFLQSCHFTSRVWSWKLLGRLSTAAGRQVSQGSLPSSITNQTVAIVVSAGSDAPLNFSFCYAYEANHAAA